jgi:hypothetical protein
MRSRRVSGDPAVWLWPVSCCCCRAVCSELLYCWSHSMLRFATLGLPIPAKIMGTKGGGIPYRRASSKIPCSIFRCSSLRDSCLVLSSSCFRFSSSAFVDSHRPMDSSNPCHCRGGSGIPAKEVDNGGGILRPGSGPKVKTDGGGRPRCCGVPIFSGTPACSEDKASWSALIDGLLVVYDGGGMKSWACLNPKSALTGRGRVSNIGSEAPMKTSNVHYTKKVLEHKSRILGWGSRKEKKQRKGKDYMN